MNSKAIKKQLLAAVAMVLVAAVALGSSTYAWFVASGSVKAEGMKVQALAESGILIKEYNNDSATFSTIATVTDATARLYPTSSYDLSKWYHAVSNSAVDSKKLIDENGPRTTYTATDYVEKTGNDLKDYRLYKQFAIRSASSTALDNSKLAISSVKATGGSASENLNKALRVGVKLNAGGNNEQLYIYAPIYTSGSFELTAAYDGNKTRTEKYAPDADNRDAFNLTSNQIPANDTGLVVDVYIWYEGEDPDCKTSNIINENGGITPDVLNISIEFAKVDTATVGV